MIQIIISIGLFFSQATRSRLLSAGVLAGVLCAAFGRAQIPPNPATAITESRNAEMYKVLDFTDQQDFIDANRGFIAGLVSPRIITNDIAQLNALGYYAWNMEGYQFLNEAGAPASVNPSLWRQERLNNINGFFEVLSNKIYQVRSYDMATMSFVKTDGGWIVIDPLTSTETARAGLALLRTHVSSNPVVAILSTHSHIDHYGGVGGILASEGKTIAPDTTPAGSAGKILYYAPDGFYEEALSENLYLGNTMFRRADYMYGSYLAQGQFGHVGSGLGKTTGFGASLLYSPSAEIVSNGPVFIDGLEVVFQLAPGTEAPAEMHIFFPEYGALCPGENVSHTMHNLLTSRGAKVRDAKAFAYYIDEAINLFGPSIKVLIGTHHWPVWGNDRCLKMLRDQRDMYRYFNDQVIRMLNNGMNMETIAESFELPAALAREFYNRGYYGTLNHNVKAVAQRYVGWWDGNPANYYKYPEALAARKYVDFMGGESAVIAKARQSYAQGDYRWVAEVMRHVVFASPANQEAKNLQADAFEQLGYSFESGTWRNIFLSGAEELRNGAIGPPVTGSAVSGALGQMPPSLIFDYLGTLVKGKEAENLTLAMRFIFTDSDLPAAEVNFYVLLHNGVLQSWNNKPDEPVGVTYILTRSRLLALLNNPSDLSGIQVAGDGALFAQLVAQFDTHNRLWNLVLPADYDNSRSNKVVKVAVISDADIDGDRKMDLVLYDNLSGTWCAKLSASGYELVTDLLGGQGWTPVAGDYDGDAKTDPGVYEEASGHWQLKLSGTGYAATNLTGFGGPGYRAVARDYDGDGKADPAIYNLTNGDWRVAMSSQGYAVAWLTRFGGPGCTAMPGNYDSDRRADAAVYNTTNGSWMVLLSASNYITGALWDFGGAGYAPVSGDFDGDGLADPAVYRESTRTWLVKLSASGYATTALVSFGGAGTIVAAGDYDGDGKADPILLEMATGIWRVRLSTLGYGETALPSGYQP